MKKALVLLALGIAAGYWWGFNDAKVHRHDIVTRLVNQAGGKTRESLKTNPDELLDSLEH